jgi:hypothetical protein
MHIDEDWAKRIEAGLWDSDPNHWAVWGEIREQIKMGLGRTMPKDKRVREDGSVSSEDPDAWANKTLRPEEERHLKKKRLKKKDDDSKR